LQLAGRRPTHVRDRRLACRGQRARRLLFRARSGDLSESLSGALSTSRRNAAAAASATSSPNITPTDRSIFSSTYTTVEWAGEVVAQDIDPATGNVVPAIMVGAGAADAARRRAPTPAPSTCSTSPP
jgi:hypothetical protein